MSSYVCAAHGTPFDGRYQCDRCYDEQRAYEAAMMEAARKSGAPEIDRGVVDLVSPEEYQRMLNAVSEEDLKRYEEENIPPDKRFL